MATRRAAAGSRRAARMRRLRGVLADIASSIKTWLGTELSPGTEIGFESPGLLAAIQRRPRRAGIVNLFLYGVSENLDGVPAARVRVRDGNGRVTGTHAPTRSYHLSYLVTAWASDTSEELELLGAVLGAHADQDCLPADFLRGSLHDLDTALPVRIGWSPVARGGDLWGALGVPMRAALDLTVTAPVLPSRRTPPAPPVHSVELEVHDTAHRELQERPTSPRWRQTSITEH